MHPIKKNQPFFLRFEGLSSWRQQQQDAARREHEHQETQQAYLRKQAEQAQFEAAARVQRTRAATWVGWLCALGFAAMLGLCALASWGCAAMRVSLSAPLLAPVAVVLLIALAVATLMVNRPIQIATQRDQTWLVFVTWFWLPFVLLMPGVGQVMALVRFDIPHDRIVRSVDDHLQRVAHALPSHQGHCRREPSGRIALSRAGNPLAADRAAMDRA